MLFNETDLKQDLEKALERFKQQIKKINTGQASMDALESVYVTAYGSSMPLNTVGNIVVPDAVTIKISIWDKSIIKEVEKALREANLGASVTAESDFIRLNFNPISQEDRKERVKMVRSELEEAKIAVRQVRQKFMKDLSALDGVSEDDKKRDEDKIQKIIDSYIKLLDETSAKKEAALMKI